MFPVFVCGCGRSGTTFVAAQLGRHPEVVVPPEAQFLVRGLAHAARASGPAGAAFIRSIRKDWRLALWQVPEIENILRQLASQGASPDEVVAVLVRHYCAAQSQPDARYWVDHTPSNVLHAKTLLKLFPNGLMLHVVRDPRAVAASVLPLDWGPSTARSAARWWMERIGAGLAAESALADRVMRVKYEDTVREPNGFASAVLPVLRLEPLAGDASSGRAVLPEYTRRQHAAVNGPPDPGRIDSWMSTLTTRQVETIEAEVGDTLSLLGYEPTVTPPVSSPAVGIGELVGEVLGPVRQRLRISRRRRQARRGRGR